MKSTALEVSKPLTIVGGLFIGNLIGKGIDKVIPVDAEATGFQIKSLVKPLVQAGLGVSVILLSKDKAKDTNGIKVLKEVARSLGYGVTGAGIISGVKLIKADLFEGLGDAGNPEKKTVETKYFREAKNEIMKMLKDNSFKPALPSPSDGEPGAEQAASEDTEVSGLSMTHDAEIL